MRIIDAQDLQSMLVAIYTREGVPAEKAEVVARHQVESNLSGHDSHGASQTKKYVDRIRLGHIVPGAEPVVVQETPSTAVIDGNWGFGFTITEEATRLAIDKARRNGVAALTIRRQGHVGRLGAYASMAADEGMLAIVMADSGLGPKSVVPYGGREARLGTNPICIGAPGGESGHPVVLDFATSAVALGKVAVAHRQGLAIPTGWVIDKDGNHTEDPGAYYSGGALLPLGADQAYKGYALSFMVEVCCGLLTGLGFGVAADGRHNDGVFMVVADVSAFLEPAEFTRLVHDFIKYLKRTPLAAGSQEILFPGEPEQRTAVSRSKRGIPIDDPTWDDLQALLVQSTHDTK